MKNSLTDIASILDDCIIKSGINKKLTISDMENRLEKGLSFNPFVPEEISSVDGSPYHTPYLMAESGGFYPHPPEYWVEQGNDPGTYREVHKFYEDAGVSTSSLESLQNLHNQSGKFSFIKNSVMLESDLLKSSGVELVIEMEKDKEEKFFIKADQEKLFIENAYEFNMDNLFISDGLIYV